VIAVRAPGRRPSLRRRVMPRGMMTRELLVTAARPRSLVIKVVTPLILTVPLITGHAPTFWSAMLLTVLVAMIGTVGTAVSIARARDSGLLTRLRLVPRAPHRVLVGWAAGSAIVDFLQLVPALAVIIVLSPVTLVAGVALVCSVAAVLMVANAIGCAVSAIGGGPGEVLLDVMVILAPLLFLGGLFTGVPRDGWRWIAAQVDPFSYLHAALIGALGGAPSFDAVAVLVAAAITACAALGLIALLARPVLHRA
jgi:ABC-2 type transport system permease protein